MNNREKRKDYTPPTLETTYVSMECGIAAGSAGLRSGNAANGDSPAINAWDDHGHLGENSNDYDGY